MRRLILVVVGLVAVAGPVPGPGGASAASTFDFPASEAIRIRSELGLRSTSDHVARSLIDPSSFPVTDFYGMPLTSDEAAELRRRIAVQQSTTDARVWAASQPGWAGVYTDQRAGGVPVFMFAGDPEEHRDGIASRLPAGTEYSLERVPRTRLELESLKAHVAAEWEALEVAGIDVLSVGIATRSNVVSVGVLGLTDGERSELLSRFPSGVSVKSESPIELDACTSRAACGAPIKGGLKIVDINGAYCTSAYIGEQDNFNPAHLRVVTAGHCIELGGGVGAGWKHNSSTFGYATAETWATGADGDVGVIDLANLYPNDNLFYASSNTDIRAFTSFALLAEMAEDDFFCRSGAKTGYRCGRVVEEDETLDVEGRLIDHQWRVDFDASPGDSGGPYWFGNKFFGIHSDSTHDLAAPPRFAWYSPYPWVSIVVSNVDICLAAAC